MQCYLKLLMDLQFGISSKLLFSYNVQLLFVQFIFFKSISCIFFIKRWIFLIKNKEASHPMNSVCSMVMFAIVAVCMLMSQPPSDSTAGVMYLVVVTMIDIMLLVASVIYYSGHLYCDYEKFYEEIVFQSRTL